MAGRSRIAAVLLAFSLAGCGGQSDAPVLQTGSAASMASPRAAIELGPPVTNEAARAVQGLAPGVDYQRKESALVVDGTPFTIDTSDREAVRLFYNRIHREPTPPMDWTGNHAAGAPGTTTPAFRAAVMQRVNWYRAMAGLPAAVRLSGQNSAKAQHAALIMSVAGQLSHTPPPTWKFYTQEGADAAIASNLALGAMGPEAIDQYIQDPGSNNGPVGHRRWIFHPNTRTMGTGDVPAGEIDGKKLWAANALWVTDVDFFGARPAVRDDFVAWPAKGYVPYATVYERWSLSYPDADFTQAIVSVTRDGAPVNLTLEPVKEGVGENTLVWKMADIDPAGHHAQPANDVRYRVSITNVVTANRARSFNYDVTVFDPAVASTNRLQPVVTAPAETPADTPYQVRIAALPGATGYSVTAMLRAAPGTTRAPLDTAHWTSANAGHHDIIADGALRFHVATNDWGLQSATLGKPLFVASDSARVLVSRTMRPATNKQRFRVQVSGDDGASWKDAYSESGADSMAPLTGTLQVALSAYRGQIIRLRLVMDATDFAYIGPDTGWHVSAVDVEGLDALTPGNAGDYRSADGAFTLSHARPGAYLLIPRVELAHLYDSDPGAPAFVTVSGATLSGPRSAYTLTRSDNVLTIVDNTGRDGTQTVRDPYRLEFTDVTLAFDIDGSAGDTYRLYRAAFNRQPDNRGLGFWTRAVDGGLPLDDMGREFARSSEFASLYGAAPTPVQLITAMYRNVLHRAPDAVGAAYWLQQLNNGLPVERLLIEFSNSPENKAQVASETALGMQYTRP